jgi:diguanylate cyclase (GGDEF)-like protein
MESRHPVNSQLCPNPPLSWRRWGLRGRLALAFAVVALLPVLTLYGIAHERITSNARLRAGKTLELIADAQQRRINLEFQRLQDQAGLIASRTQMRVSLAAYNREGHPDHLSMIQRILADALKPVADLRGIWIRDPAGKVVASVTQNGTSTTSIEDSLAPSRDTEPILFRDLGGVAPELWISTPLSLDGHILGSLHLLIQLDRLQAILSDFCSRDHGGETVLLLRDADTRLFAFTAGTGLWEVATALAGPLNDLLRAEFKPAGPLLEPVQTAPRTDLLRALRPLELDQARVLVYTSLANIERLTRADLNLLLLVTTGLILLTLLMAFFMARAITEPIRVLTQATQTLRSGDYRVRVAEHPWGELALLTRSFNETTAALSQHNEALQAEIEVRQQAEQDLANLANTDALTGLSSRRHFLDLLKHRLDQERQAVNGGALLYLDLDRFKPINDLYGHDAGDAVLRIVAERLRRVVRERDCIGRLGGDEFAVLLTDCEPGFEPETIVWRLRESLNRPMTIKGHHLQIDCSVGVADITPESESNGLLNQADTAMYLAKAANQRPSSTTMPRERTNSGAGSTAT